MSHTNESLESLNFKQLRAIVLSQQASLTQSNDNFQTKCQENARLERTMANTKRHNDELHSDLEALINTNNELEKDIAELREHVEPVKTEDTGTNGPNIRMIRVKKGDHPFDVIHKFIGDMVNSKDGGCGVCPGCIAEQGEAKESDESKLKRAISEKEQLTQDVTRLKRKLAAIKEHI